MSSAPFTFNLFIERETNFPFAEKRNWISRLDLSQTPERFLLSTDEDILVQSIQLKSSTKYIATSYKNKYLVAIDDQRIAIFKL